MKNFKEFFDLAIKAASSYLGVAEPDEQKELEDYSHSSLHRQKFLEELNCREEYEKNQDLLAHFPTEEGWEKITPRMGGTSTGRRIVRLLPFAALFIILLGAGLFFVFTHFQSTSQQQFAGQIVSGKEQAVRLVLGNGDVVNLSAKNTFLHAESDGTIVKKDSLGLNYEVNDPISDTSIFHRMETCRGMDYAFNLSDETRVHLNAESSLSFPVAFKGEKRIVDLEGEAFFTVSKDEAHPFIVRTNGIEIRVLGTSFNVKSYADEDEVVTTLVEGKVEIDGHKLLPGDQAVYLKTDKSLEVRQIDVENYVSWKTGKFIFRNAKLSDVMKTLSRWYDFDYHFDRASTGDICVGASFSRRQELDSILLMLENTNLVKIYKEKNTLFISAP